MNNPEHLTYSIDKNRLRIGAALGVIVITAGFALGSVMHTSANEPAAPVTDNTPTGNESDQTTNNTSSVSNDQPVADKESVANGTSQTQVDETEAEEAEVEETEVDEADEAEEAEVEETEVDEAEETADETEAEEAETEKTDADESDETENDGNDDDNSNGFGWDLGLVLPENLIDPLPLPDDLGPIGPIGPIGPGI